MAVEKAAAAEPATSSSIGHIDHDFSTVARGETKAAGFEALLITLIWSVRLVLLKPADAYAGERGRGWCQAGLFR